MYSGFTHSIHSNTLPHPCTQVQPYANTLGLLALPASAGEGELAACLDAVRRAAAVHPPEYD